MSQFSVVDEPDHDRWDRFVDEHPKGSIFHTSSMRDVFRDTKHYEPLVLAALDGAGEILALLLAVRVQTLPGPLGSISSRSILYAEPLCRADAHGVDALTTLLAEHDARMRNRVLFTEVRPLRAAGLERIALQHGSYAHEDYLNYLICLRRPASELWDMMTKECRKNIRGSSKRGVTVDDMTTAQGVEILYHILQRTYERAKVPLADRSMFAAAFAILQPRGLMKIFIAWYQERPVAAQVVLLYKHTVYAWHAGVERIKSIYPGESVTWYTLEWGQRQGYELFDFGGAGWPHKPYGVRDFKAKFGGELVNYGRYRRVYAPWKLAVAERGYEVARNLVNPTNWRLRIKARHAPGQVVKPS
jgi:lipid II:glycine glycyltransferase (peptidoglycan interpeptide bridge formation enzyme)